MTGNKKKEKRKRELPRAKELERRLCRKKEQLKKKKGMIGKRTK